VHTFWPDCFAPSGLRWQIPNGFPRPAAWAVMCDAFSVGRWSRTAPTAFDQAQAEGSSRPKPGGRREKSVPLALPVSTR
jgi:hypothetical protein